MKTEFVLAGKNLEKQIKLAEALGYKQLFIIYEYRPKIDFKDIKSSINLLSKNTKMTLLLGLLSDGKNIMKAKNLTKFIFCDVKSESPQSVRTIIENKKPFLIYNLEFQKKDFIHHRNSGLNQVYCDLLKKNKIRLGLSFSFLVTTNHKANVIGRMMQNIIFARKFGFKINIGNFSDNELLLRSSEDINSLLIDLGMHPSEANLSQEV